MQLEMLTRPELGQPMRSRIPELCDLAATGLVQMFDVENQIFCHTFTRTPNGMERQGLSPRYTLMTLLGLHRYERSGRRSPLAIAPVLDKLCRSTDWLTSAGDLGLLLWACAELAPDRVPEIYENCKVDGALSRFEDGREGRTMEVAWYLTGLAGCCSSGYSDLPGLMEQIAAARAILKSNCGPSGVYGHLSRSSFPKGYFRRRIGSFADQVYPTIAMAGLSQALLDSESREMALRTARKMCELQGAMGEWSWHYDAASGKVISRYPVYSVHQHAMAPMMLFAAGEGADCEFSAAILKGLDWIGGNNELQRDFIDPALNLVWRCIYLSPADAYADAARRFFFSKNGPTRFQLQIRYECRPYELGWLLYAFAGK